MSWFGDLIDDVGRAASGAFSVLKDAAGAPITSSWQATHDLVNGRPLASFKATLSGMGRTLAPVGKYTEAFGEGFVNFGRGAYNFGAGVVEGDSKKAVGGVAGGLVAGTNVAAGDATIAKLGGEDPAAKSLTGYSGLAYGNYSSQNYNRALATTAVIATGAAASSFAATAPGEAAVSGLVDGAVAGGISLLKKAGDTVVNTAGDLATAAGMDAVFGSGPGSGTNSAPPYASPGKSAGLLSSDSARIAVGAAAVVAGVLIIRRLRK